MSASPSRCGVWRSWGTTASTMPMTATSRKSAGKSRRARPAQNRRRRIVPLPPHSLTSSEVIKKPERTKNESTP